ncbi:hypothetical protein A3SI_04552 [Nitritalea halalkaliphila LW7]|uniref:Uncharacterized protein n=1 Tax=Nitritalea halalkaliphila LW7 TaxID=1189621 RepID=I5C8A9_9BACT|nr:hypothetical protein [Nitritalea halalkaliphila]EIM78061.1 hypothetical protein A3SI_04552 [Nitritalea halalkaliphila LW7]
MEKLTDNWIAEGWMDMEYKKYLLLAYLKHVSGRFREVKLYPPLADLIYHYQKLTSMQAQKDRLRDAFPKRILGPDPEKMAWKYGSAIPDDEAIQVLEELLHYAIPQLKKYIEEGKTIYDFLEEEMEFSPVGITPLYRQEGYAILGSKEEKHLHIYRYKVGIFTQARDSFKGIMMQFVQSIRRSLADTVEAIKLRLIREYRDLPNPAVYSILSNRSIPLQETFLPMSKRLLLIHLSEEEKS